MASNRRKKPLMGAKKYSRLPLKCHTQGCKNDGDFFVAIPNTTRHTTPTHKRYCKEHYNQRTNPAPKPQTAKQQEFRKVLVALGLAS